MDLLVIIGMAGVVLVIAGYALLATGRVIADSYRYQGLNVVGTCGVLVSLVGQWNLPSLILNSAWLVIGVVAMLKISRKKRPL